jgi:integrase
VLDVLNIYLIDKAPKHSDPTITKARVMTLAGWWGDKTLAQVNGTTCREYVAYRTSQPRRAAKPDVTGNPARMVTAAGARRELEDLRSAINHHRTEGLCSVASVRKSFAAAVRAAKIDRHITPHICRHTAATWAMQQGSDIWDAAGYLGMSPELLERVYGHHHPDFQSDVAARMSGQNRDRNTVNKRGQAATDTTKIINFTGGRK